MAQTPEHPDGQNSQNSQQPQQGYYYPYGPHVHPNAQQGGQYQQQPYGAQGYGHQGYGHQSYTEQGSNSYASYGNQYYHAQAGPPLTFGQGDGKLSVADALQYGFSAVMRNGTSWLIGALLFVGIYVVYRGGMFLSSLFAPLVGNMSTAAVLFVFTLPLSYGVALGVNGALQQMDRGIVPFGDFMRGQRLVITTMLLFLWYLVTIFVPVAAMLFMVDTAATPPPFMAIIIAGCLAVVVVAVISILVSMVPFYLLDGRGTIASCIGQALSDSVRNFFPLLLLWIVIGPANVVGSLLCGIGLIATLPVSFLALSYAYRQMSRGQIQLLTS